MRRVPFDHAIDQGAGDFQLAASPLRLVHVPLDRAPGSKAGLALLFDSAAASQPDSTNVQALLDLLPLGLALVDRDGRFLTTNKAFRTAGGIGDTKSLDEAIEQFYNKRFGEEKETPNDRKK